MDVTEHREKKMTKFEFLGDLSRLIADLPPEDREQAMEYYEEYFADAGPEHEQEIINDFISPAYIAQQLHEASARRQKTLAANTGNISSIPVSAAQPVQQAQQVPQMQPQAQQMPQMQAQQIPQMQAQQIPQMQPQAQQVSQTLSEPQAQQASQTQESAAQSESSESAAMRNPIFQQTSEEDEKKNEDLLALKKRTKVDVKSIHAATSKVDKKQARAAAKQNAANEKQHNAALYSGPKKAILAALLIITCPISLSILGIIIGLFLLVFGIVIGFVLLGISALAVSIISLLLSILSLLTVHIPNSVFTLGTALLLFSAGIGIFYADFKLVTRAIPSAYFSLLVLFNNVKATLRRFTLK